MASLAGTRLPAVPLLGSAVPQTQYTQPNSVPRPRSGDLIQNATSAMDGMHQGLSEKDKGHCRGLRNPFLWAASGRGTVYSAYATHRSPALRPFTWIPFY